MRNGKYHAGTGHEVWLSRRADIRGWTMRGGRQAENRPSRCSIRGVRKNVGENLHSNKDETLLVVPVSLCGSKCWCWRKEDDRRLLVARPPSRRISRRPPAGKKMRLS